MCDHCVDGKIPVRILLDDGEEWGIVGETVLASIVDNTGTVYITLNQSVSAGATLAITVPELYGEK